MLLQHMQPATNNCPVLPPYMQPAILISKNMPQSLSWSLPEKKNMLHDTHPHNTKLKVNIPDSFPTQAPPKRHPSANSFPISCSPS